MIMQGHVHVYVVGHRRMLEKWRCKLLVVQGCATYIMYGCST